MRRYLCTLIGYLLVPGLLYGMPIFEPGILIVTTKPYSRTQFQTQDVTRTQAAFHAGHNIRRVRELPLRSQGFHTQSTGMTVSKILILECSPTADIESLSRVYREQNWVQTAGPNYYVTVHELSDPGYVYQTWMGNTNLRDFLTISESAPIKVAIVDSGIDTTHPDLTDALWKNPGEIPDNNLDDDHNGYVDDITGYNFFGTTWHLDNNQTMDYFGHGTHLAGIIGARANNGIGIKGLSQQVQLIAARFLDSTGKGTQLDAAAAIYYAVDAGARIINCSWGYKYNNAVVEDAIRYAVQKNVLVVASAGNDGNESANYPAAYDGVLAIASISEGNAHASYSNTASFVDFAEYGNSIYSTGLYHDYEYKTGTSQSAAVMSGIISRVLSHSPYLTPSEIHRLLIQCASDLPPYGKDTQSGFGLINPSDVSALLDKISESDRAAILDIQSQTNTADQSVRITSLLSFPNPATGTMTSISFVINQSDEVSVGIYDLSGRKIRELQVMAPGGQTTTLSWDLTSETGQGVPNGTYFAVAKPLSGIAGLKRTKLTILR